MMTPIIHCRYSLSLSVTLTPMLTLTLTLTLTPTLTLTMKNMIERPNKCYIFDLT